MSYFDKPKKTPVVIHRVENGFLVCLGVSYGREDLETYIATEVDLPTITAKAIESAKQQDEAALGKWDEKEKKTAEGYEWAKKKGDSK
jgi:hypothetical protein